MGEKCRGKTIKRSKEVSCSIPSREKIKKPLCHLVDLPVGSSPSPPLLSLRSPAETSSASGLASMPASKAEEAVNFYKATFGAEEAIHACCSKRKSDQEQLSLLCAESRSETPP
ncbi:hypothetical protein FCM35_KLT12048 [Carex littledalei]|uniref:Glyoxalase At5g48480-like N-terminal domain-containing protein n=1 Tax=Carex littledalei TaxID=544730 RepID=A0A833QJZ8_9POAL|nr:hypothetical protein FCM35_KLT12048 [Carex littledalei]